MTPEEELAMRAAVVRTLQQPPPGMVNQTAQSPEQAAALQAATASNEGMKRKLQAQQAMADRLRATKTPEGRQAGNIYRASSPFEHLGQLAQVAVGQHKSNQLGDQYAALDRAESERLAGLEQLKDLRTQQAQGFQTSEREAGQGFKQALNQENIAANIDLAGINNQADTERALMKIAADKAAADRAVGARREEAVEGQNFMLDGKVVHLAKDATGNYHMGTIDGPVLDDETMSRAVEYRPGVEGGTMADSVNFQMPVEEAGQATPAFMGNLLTSDYFDSATGAFNPERWGGAVAVGPDGKMIQATQSQMATAALEPMATRMEEINLRPWTEKEIETITADFPDANSKYPDWANFTLNIMAPRLNARFAEAKQAGRSDEATQTRVMSQLYGDVIEGARKNGMPLSDLVTLGLPREVIEKYLKSLQ